MKNQNNKFSENIKEIRKQMELTQEQFAEKLSISIPTVRAYESGLKLPKLENLVEYCCKLSVSMNDLLMDKPQKVDTVLKSKLELMSEDNLKELLDIIRLLADQA